MSNFDKDSILFAQLQNTTLVNNVINIDVYKLYFLVSKLKYLDENLHIFIDFVCNFYQQSRKNSMLTKLADLRWRFYSQKQSQGGITCYPLLLHCVQLYGDVIISAWNGSRYLATSIKLWLDNGKQNLWASSLRSSMSSRRSRIAWPWNHKFWI